jgi:DNA repair photolyase
MPALPNYECSLGVTSQFYFCGLPVRLDAYSHCSYRCSYCFAAARGGQSRQRPLQVIDPAALRRRLNRVASGAIRGAIDEFISHRQPMHFGGMSDPFPPMESRHQITKQTLEVLTAHNYPAIISTKGTEVASTPYLRLLEEGRYLVQLSISSFDDELISRVDRGAPPPSERLRAMDALAKHGVPVSCRIQPLLPGREEDALRLIDLCAQAGARHVATEHLKLPIERKWPGTVALSRALGRDLHADFVAAGATRLGREWVLPVESRLPRQVRLRSQAHQAGVSFAAADNDLMLMSDGRCCCSGADDLPGFQDYFRFNYLEAAHRGLESGEIRFDALNEIWRPRGTVSRFVNSRSRLPARNGRGPGVEEYVRENWSGRPNGCSPELFHGVSLTARTDSLGMPIYGFDREARELYRHSAPARPA